MRRYELALVADPTIPEEEHDRLITAFEQTIAERSGNVLKVDRWGRRKLAYKINGQSEGNYTFILFDADSPVVSELSRRIRLSESWLRHSVVRADHEKPPTSEELEALAEARQEQIRRAKEREERERLAREEAAARGLDPDAIDYDELDEGEDEDWSSGDDEPGRYKSSRDDDDSDDSSNSSDSSEDDKKGTPDEEEEK